MRSVQFMRGEGSIQSPYEIDDMEPRASSPSASDSSYPRGPHREGVATSGQRAKRRDNRYMSSRERRKVAKRVSDSDGPRSQSPIVPKPPSPAPQPLVVYEGRLVPIERKATPDVATVEGIKKAREVANAMDDIAPGDSVSMAASNPQFVEGSSRPGIGWRREVLSGVASTQSFEDAHRCWVEYKREDEICSMEWYSDDIE